MKPFNKYVGWDGNVDYTYKTTSTIPPSYSLTIQDSRPSIGEKSFLAKTYFGFGDEIYLTREDVEFIHKLKDMLNNF